jgi:two-component system, chemotaxis family, protein-glutamate methylesterase/glutaminase
LKSIKYDVCKVYLMSITNKIRVLVIDDSLFMRQMIPDILNADPDITVVGVAIHGRDGLKKIEKLNPDVVTLDYEMPGLDGIATLKRIMRDHPLPVVMISAHTRKGGEITLEALAQGAVDYVLKPSGPISLDISKVKDEIIERIKIAAQANLKAVNVRILTDSGLSKPLKAKSYNLKANKVVAIGSSTGGTKGVELILESLPSEFPAPILIVQHMPKMFTALFADRLNRLSKMRVKEGEDKEEVKAGIAYIAPGGWHMKVQAQGSSFSIQTSKEPSVYGLRPSVDMLFKSVARAYGANAIGIILSGMGSDGTDGLEAIYKSRGKTIAQDEKTSVVFGMPRRAIEAGVVDDVLPIDKIARRITEYVKA